MNILSRDQQNSIIAALTEGCSIRSVERLTGVHRDTIMRLSVRVDLGAARLHDPRCTASGSTGSRWTKFGATSARSAGKSRFTAMAATAKAIISYRVGKRDGTNTRAFVADLRERVL